MFICIIMYIMINARRPGAIIVDHSQLAAVVFFLSHIRYLLFRPIRDDSYRLGSIHSGACQLGSILGGLNKIHKFLIVHGFGFCVRILG